MTALGLRSWNLQRRILASLLLVVLLVLAGVIAAAVALNGVRSAQREVINGYFNAVTASNDEFNALVDAETGVRGYALTGDPSALEPARALPRQGSGATEAQLRRFFSHDATARQALDAWMQASHRWEQEWADPTVAQVQAQGASSVTPAQVERGKQLFDTVRSTYADYISTVRDRRGGAVAALERRVTLLFWVVVGVGAVAVGTTALLAWLLRRWVTRPLEELAAESRIVSAGDLDHEVTVDGPPEIVRLGHDVEGMRQHLVDEVASARRAREQLASAHARLEDQTADLERSNRELEQFAYVASHDLQEPLRKVASFCQLLERRYGGQLDDRADQYIEFAVDGAKRMQQLINDLLNFSRVGRLTAGSEPVALQECLDRALRDLSTAIDESGAVVTHDELPTVLGERPLLTQVLVNLVGNAVKFKADRPPRVHIGVRRDGDTWQMWCQDNGIGIEPQYAERVFVIFQRLHPKDLYGGTGIGLALCKKIVEHHGGTIWVDPAPAEGTRICWTLPVRTETSPTDNGDQEVARTAPTAQGAPHVA